MVQQCNQQYMKKRYRNNYEMNTKLGRDKYQCTCEQCVRDKVEVKEVEEPVYSPEPMPQREEKEHRPYRFFEQARGIETSPRRERKKKEEKWDALVNFNVREDQKNKTYMDFPGYSPLRQTFTDDFENQWNEISPDRVKEEETPKPPPKQVEKHYYGYVGVKKNQNVDDSVQISKQAYNHLKDHQR